MKVLSKILLMIVLMVALSGVARADDPREAWGNELFEQAESFDNIVSRLLSVCKKLPLEEIFSGAGVCSPSNLRNISNSLQTFFDACPICRWDGKPFGPNLSALDHSIHQTINDLSLKRKILTGKYSVSASEQEFNDWWNYRKEIMRRQQQMQMLWKPIYSKIIANWSRPDNLKPNLEVVILVTITPHNGVVKRVEVFDSSGDGLFDKSVVNAVKKLSRFPKVWVDSGERKFDKWLFVISSND